MNLSRGKAKENLAQLIQKFERELNSGKINDYNEEATKTAFIQPFLRNVLGWNVSDRDEVSPEERVSHGRVDYGLKIEGQTKIFIEVKPPKADLKKHIEQAVGYGYNRKSVPFVLLTDFEGIKLFDVTIKPDARNSLKGLKIDLDWKEYLDKFDEIWKLSKESVLKGVLDKELLKKPKDRLPVDKAILDDLRTWRERLAKDIFKNNTKLFHSPLPSLPPRVGEEKGGGANYLKEITQRILDRIMFMRSCEDRKLIHRRSLKELFEERTETVGINTMVFLEEEFKRYNDIFDSDLFRPQDWEKNLLIDFKVMQDIILETYNPYQFDVIPLEVLGNMYEQYLGYTIRLTDHQVKYELKPEVRKAGGVYYTPEYIVDYIVKNTVGKLLKELPTKKIQKLRILDPACGSGSFLIRAYEEMLNYYRSQKKKKPRYKKGQEELGLKEEETEPILTIGEKSKILCEHIFGVDIDEQAVEVTKLSLMLKMLEGEFGIIPGRNILPMLDRNIRCGNSLISGDTLELKKYFGDDWYKVKAFNWKDGFRKIMLEEGGFDVVIGNPPYRKERDSKDLIKEIKESHLGQLYYEGKMDLWYFFLHRGLEVTKINGLISFIVPSYWLMGTGSKKLIMHIKNDGKINFFVSFNKNKIFKEVSGRHLIFNISRNRVVNDYQFKIIDFIQSGLSDLELKMGLETEKHVKKNIVKFNDVFYEGKIMLSRTGFFDKLKVSTIRLGLICEVSQGIVEAPDRISSKMLAGAQSRGNNTVGQGVFVLSKRELDKINPNEKEQMFLKKYLDARDVSRYSYAWGDNYIWYVGNKENKHICANKNNYKNMILYLDSLQQFITSSNKPYGIHRTRQKHFFENFKLLCKNMIDKPCFTYCGEEMYVNLSFNVVILRDKSYSLKYVLGLINSKFGECWFNANAKKRGFNIDIGVAVMRKFPIRKIDFSQNDEENCHDNIVKLVDVMLDLNKKIQNAKGTEKEQIQRQIEKTDKEIDDLVYKLYGITEEERKVIEGAV